MPATPYSTIARQLLGDKCNICGSTEGLVIHHKDKNRENNDPENLQLLCSSCHKKKHWSSGKFTKPSLKKELMDYIVKFIEENPELGYRSLAQFIEDAARRRIEELQKKEGA